MKPENHSKQPRKPRSIKELDEGQLDLMWDFLRFRKNDKVSIHDIIGLEKSLNAIRQMMIQKTAGQPEYSHEFYEDYDDLGTRINIVVCTAMSIMLSGGLEILKEHCDSKDSVGTVGTPINIEKEKTQYSELITMGKEKENE